MIKGDFAGLNNFVWFVGTVVDIKDPAQVGRVRVRIIGWHNENKNLQPDDELPWAQIVLPVNNPRTLSLPKPGEQVFGFFQDGLNAQIPVVIGVHPRVQSEEPKTANSSTEVLKALEAQLVLEKATLKKLETGYQGTTKQRLVEEQKKKIATLEKNISNLKASLKREPTNSWGDPRTQEEVNGSPKQPSGVVQYVLDEPTLPRIGRGIMEGTLVNKNNKDLAHVCDFISEMQKNINLKKYTKALANEIREMIRKVLKALGFTDATGQFSWVLNTLKSFARELRRIQKEIIQPIIDFEKYVLAYITKIRGMITWLLNLPERFLNMLRDCYLRLLKLIKQVLTDTILGFKEGADMDEFNQVLNAAGDVVNEVYNTVEKAQVAFAGAQIIVTSATTGLLVPVSESEVESANNYINTYTSSSNNAIVSAMSSLQLP